MLLSKARGAAFGRLDFVGAERLYRDILPKVAVSRTVTENATQELGNIVLTRGRIAEGLHLMAEPNQRQADRGRPVMLLETGIDSALVTSLVRGNAALAREVLERSLRRTPLDAFALVDRPYEDILWAATFSGDAALAQQARADFQRVLVGRGKRVDRPATEAMSDGLVSLATGHPDQAAAKFNDADRLLEPCTECVRALRFIAYDKAGRADSAIVDGEAFLKTIRAGGGFVANQALFRGAILQRLGELYEAKAQPEKALQHYQSFVDLWQNADPELQPRVRDVRARIARLQAAAAKKG
jgi:tetratricopeptide (TPR) repeat protein